MLGRWPKLAVVLLLAGCAALVRPAVLVDTRAPARLETRSSQGLFLATVVVDGRPAGPFVVDSGATALILDVELARVLGLRIHARGHDRVLGQTVRTATLGTLQAGPVLLRNTPVAVIDFGVPSRALGERLAGALGYPFFAGAIVEVDYGARVISCFAPDAYELPAAQWRPLIVRGGHPAVVARVDGHAEGEFLLDTGSTSVAYLSTTFLRRHPDVRVRDVRDGTHIVIAGERPVREGTVGSLELAGRRFERPRVAISASAEDDVGVTDAAPLSARFDGLIGNGLLRHFVVVFNYPAGKIAFLPRRPTRAPSA